MGGVAGRRRGRRLSTRSNATPGNRERAFQEYNQSFRPFVEVVQGNAVRFSLERCYRNRGRFLGGTRASARRPSPTSGAQRLIASCATAGAHSVSCLAIGPAFPGLADEEWRTRRDSERGAFASEGDALSS